MANKYLEKIAGLRSALHDFGEHLSGKALEKAKMEKSLNQGASLANKIERSHHDEMVFQHHGNPNRLSAESNRHSNIMNGQNQMQNHILHRLKSGDHLNETHMGKNIEHLTVKRNVARGVVAGTGAASLTGAYSAGRMHANDKQ